MKEHQVAVPITAPYFTLNELTEKTERVWLVFHGYGQLSKYFLRKFEGLDSKKNFIIAPQGLSKYYLEGVYGRVGASWMTKEDRLTEIKNQHLYIDRVLADAGDLSNKQLIYFGFSQGTATMGRYAAYAKRSFSQMVIWAGTFPPDTDPDDWKFLTGDEKISYYTSRKDIYFKEDMIEKQNSVVKQAIGKKPDLHWYEGGHRVVQNLVSGL